MNWNPLTSSNTPWSREVKIIGFIDNWTLFLVHPHWTSRVAPAQHHSKVRWELFLISQSEGHRWCTISVATCSSRTQLSSLPDITGMHNTWESVLFLLQNCWPVHQPLTHIHTVRGRSHLMNPEPTSLCWVCIYCCQVLCLGRWSSSHCGAYPVIRWTTEQLLGWALRYVCIIYLYLNF